MRIRSLLLLLSCYPSVESFTTTAPRGWRSAQDRTSPLRVDNTEQQQSSAAANKRTKVVKRKVVKKRRPPLKKQQATRLKREWDHAWVPRGERREKIRSLIKQLQKEHFANFSKHSDDAKEWASVKEFLEQGMDILTQWAQIGEASVAQSLLEKLMEYASATMRLKHMDEFAPLQTKLYRRVLHAHYNQLQRITWNQQSRKPKFSLTGREQDLGLEVLQKADALLVEMESSSRTFTTSKNVHPMVDALDYSPLIMGYYQVGGQSVSALRALRKLVDLWVKSNYLPRLAPSVSLYIAVSKAIVNSRTTEQAEWKGYMGNKESKVEQVTLLVKQCAQFARDHSAQIKCNMALYNIALDAWSKVLSPPSKKNAGRDFFIDEQRDEITCQVAHQVAELDELAQKDGFKANARTYSSLIYAYTKANKLDDATNVMNRLMEYMKASPSTERFDARSLRMLANGYARHLRSLTTDEPQRLALAERVEEVIDFMWQLTEMNQEGAMPDVFLYTTAVDAWAMASCSQSALRAQMLVDDLVARNAEHEESSNGYLQPDIALYNALIKAYTKQPGLKDAANKTGAIINMLKEVGSGVQPDVQTYNGLIDACIASGTPQDITNAEQTLQRMVETGSPPPNANSYKSMIYALLKERGGTARAEIWLDRMEERYLPTSALYGGVIMSWCEESATRAERLLERMEQLFYAHDDNETLRPSRALYNAVIQALEDQQQDADSIKTKRDDMYGSAIVNQKLRSNNQVFALLNEIDANVAGAPPTGNTYNFNYILAKLADSGKVWAGLRAEDVLNYMLELTFKRKNTSATPDIVTFNTVMDAWAKSNHALAGEKAAAVFKRLGDLHDMGLIEDVVADRVSYNTLMSAYAKSYDTEDSGQRAQNCFDEMETLYYENMDERYKPDQISYATLISAWARSNEEESAKTAEKILYKMYDNSKSDPTYPRPSTLCFNEVIYAWARSNEPRAAQRAEMVLELMRGMADYGYSDVLPNTRTYNIVLLALANCPNANSPILALKLLDEMKHMSPESNPDSVSYNTAISAFIKRGSTAAAMQILQELFIRKDVLLDSKFFESLLYTIADTETPAGAKVADKIVADLVERRDEYMYVDTGICNALIQCWIRSGSLETSQRVQAILDDMLKPDGKYLAKPDVVTFTSVIDALAKSNIGNAPDRAEDLLDKMATHGVQPNVQTYTSAIQVFARSSYRDKAKRARDMMVRMQTEFREGNRDAEPNVFSYNAVLNAAEFTVGNELDLEEAFEVACDAFDQVRSKLSCDHVTYGSFMGVISQLMPKSDLRNDMIQLVFRRCCVDGQLSPMVVKKFKEAADASQYAELMGRVTSKSLPKEWTCNVRGSRQ